MHEGAMSAAWRRGEKEKVQEKRASAHEQREDETAARLRDCALAVLSESCTRENDISIRWLTGQLGVKPSFFHEHHPLTEKDIPPPDTVRAHWQACLAILAPAGWEKYGKLIKIFAEIASEECARDDREPCVPVGPGGDVLDSLALLLDSAGIILPSETGVYEMAEPQPIKSQATLGHKKELDKEGRRLIGRALFRIFRESGCGKNRKQIAQRLHQEMGLSVNSVVVLLSGGNVPVSGGEAWKKLFAFVNQDRFAAAFKKYGAPIVQYNAGINPFTGLSVFPQKEGVVSPDPFEAEVKLAVAEESDDDDDARAAICRDLQLLAVLGGIRLEERARLAHALFLSPRAMEQVLIDGDETALPSLVQMRTDGWGRILERLYPIHVGRLTAIKKYLGPEGELVSREEVSFRGGAAAVQEAKIG